MKFEYAVASQPLNEPISDTKTILDMYGEGGWELVSVVACEYLVADARVFRREFYFKRAIIGTV